MTKVTLELSMSLDGFVAGPNDGLFLANEKVNGWRLKKSTLWLV